LIAELEFIWIAAREPVALMPRSAAAASIRARGGVRRCAGLPLSSSPSVSRNARFGGETRGDARVSRDEVEVARRYRIAPGRAREVAPRVMRAARRKCRKCHRSPIATSAPLSAVTTRGSPGLIRYQPARTIFVIDFLRPRDPRLRSILLCICKSRARHSN